MNVEELLQSKNVPFVPKGKDFVAASAHGKQQTDVNCEKAGIRDLEHDTATP